MNRWHTKSFKTDDITSKRIDALAEHEDRSISKMLHILVIEALNQRECATIIREAEAGKQEAQ
jgi:predicted transcriptional regulator